MRFLVASVPVLVLATTATALAQPALTPLAAPASPAAPAPQESTGDKDPGVATLLSIAGTVVPSALVLSAAGTENGSAGLFLAGLLGMELGPSLGHWYAGDYLTAGLGMRAGGTALLVVGLGEALQCLDVNDGSCHSGGEAPLLIGAGLFVTGSIYDIATAGRAANQWNKEHLRLAPTMISSAGHSTVGVGLGGSF